MSDPINNRCNKIYRQLLKVPVFGEVLLITNTYTFDGDLTSNYVVAPVGMWFKKHFSSLLIAILLAILSTPDRWFSEEILQYWPAIVTGEHKLTPGSLIISIFPNMLGFGIGVYALIFGLSSILIKKIHQNLIESKSGQNSPGSVLLLNADMAYLLMIMTSSLAIGIFQQIYIKSEAFEAVTWVALWYSLLMVFEILTALFALGESELISKVADK